MPDMVAVDASFFPSPEMTALHSAEKTLKRKAVSDSFEDILTSEGRDTRIKELNLELEGLFSYYKELSDRSVVNFNWPDNIQGLNLNALVSCSIEESSKPLTSLVDDVISKFSKYSSHAGMTAAMVKSLVLTIGQRSFYGVANTEADILEDDSESCLWCWETRNLKLMPKSVRGVIKVRRIGRKKIHIRITAISDMINVLAKFDAGQKNEHTRLSENLLKVLDEDDIRSLMHSITQKNPGDDGGGVNGEEKCLRKEIEQSRRERNRQERAAQKEKLQNERAQKRLRLEAERDEKRREIEMKKQREEREKDERKREREEAEQRKHTAVQKQASIMERFVKKKSREQTPATTTTAVTAQLSVVTRTMDATLAMEEADLNAITQSHASSWRSIGETMRATARVSCWGMRKTPAVAEIEEKTDKPPRFKKQLLQFDKTHCPAFYGTWPKTSEVVGPRHPLRKDPDLDYEFDSDGEWEEEDPGESLSACEEEEDDDENEYGSEDEFLVPDGYLSENEGVDVDRGGVEERCCRTEEDRGLFVVQQKQLCDVTDHALMKNHAFVVVNLTPGERVKNVEYACLQALTMMPFPATAEDDQQPLPPSFDLPKMVSVIQSCPHGINRVLECLQQEFPSMSKSRLKNKVREIATFSDNHWQVRKDVLDELGISASPERVSRNKTIISFFSKRCLPPPRVDKRQAP